MAVFWKVTECSLVEELTAIIRVLITFMMEAVSSSEISVNVQKITCCYIPDSQPSSYSSPWEPEISLISRTLLWKS
jgi:hypothetical protein